MAAPAYKRFAVKQVLSLPTPILRAFSGGAAVYRGGRTLDPRFQFLAAVLVGATPDLKGQPPALVRRRIAKTLALVQGPREPEARVSAVTVEGPRGPINCRLYRPAFQDSEAPVMVYAHGGGGVGGDLETSDLFCAILSVVGEQPVLAVDYALAPEHRFPAGLEDVLAVFRHARERAEDYGSAPGKAAIGGDDMGANFAAVICQRLKAEGERQPEVQLLLYPPVDLAGETPSKEAYAGTFPFRGGLLPWLYGHYMGVEANPADPRLSPAKAADLSGLAPAVIAAAGFDPLVDEVDAYASALRKAGVRVAYRCYDGLPHGFASFVGVSAAADEAAREIAALARDAARGL